MGRIWAAKRGESMRCVAMLLLVFGRAARACTVCDSATAQAVRGGIFQDHFLERAVLVLLPFAAFLLVGMVLYFAMPVPRRVELP